ncbi:hypothetical protein [Patiriisocius marinus]|nr:hypothetical protein [Patiriisocius marinus]
MDLDEIKNQWSELSQRVDTLELINKSQVMEITKEKYKSKFSCVQRYEGAGAIVCFIMAIVILLNFHKFDIWYEYVGGGVLLFLLIAMPLFVLTTLQRTKGVIDYNKGVGEIAKAFAKEKKQLILVQKLSIPFTVIAFVTALPVFSGVFDNGDFFERMDAYLLGTISVTLVLVIAVSILGYKKYTRIIARAEVLIDEIKD